MCFCGIYSTWALEHPHTSEVQLAHLACAVMGPYDFLQENYSELQTCKQVLIQHQWITVCVTDYINQE